MEYKLRLLTKRLLVFLLINATMPFFTIALCFAKVATGLELSKIDISYLKQIEAQLNATQTIQTRFIQLSSNGEYSEGKLFIKRPGKLRIVYDSPNPLMVIADGKYISYIDRELDEATTVLLSMTKAELLLRQSISFFSNDVIVTGFKKSPGYIKVNIARSDEPETNTVTLIFNDSPLELRKWTVTDALGITTTVSFIQAMFNIAIPKEKFIYVPAVKPELNPNN